MVGQHPSHSCAFVAPAPRFIRIGAAAARAGSALQLVHAKSSPKIQTNNASFPFFLSGAWKTLDMENERLTRAAAAVGAETLAKLKDLNILVVGCKGACVCRAFTAVISFSHTFVCGSGGVFSYTHLHRQHCRVQECAKLM